MSEPPELRCEVCSKPAAGVRSSSMVAVSFAYCQECIEATREPYCAVVGGLMGTGGDPDRWAAWVTTVIEPTLAFYGKTLQDLKADILKSEADYDRYCHEQELAAAKEPL